MLALEPLADPRQAAFVERLCRQQPLAVIHFGSSLRPADFVPGVSDFDLVVLSREPLVDVDNDVGCEYFFLTPHEFVSKLAAGNMFWSSALQTGRVLFDPQGFVRSLRALVDSGLTLEPTLVTLRNTVDIVTRQLSAAMNLYLSGRRDAATRRAVFRCVYSAAKGLGAYHAIAANGANPHGYEGIARAVRGYPELEQLMRRTRARLQHELAAAGVDPPAAPPSLHTEIGDDELGGAILEVENAFCDSLALLPGRRRLRELVREYLREHAPLTRTLAVSLDVSRNHQLVAAQAGARYHVFGTTDLRRVPGRLALFDLPDHDSLARFLGWPDGVPPTGTHAP